MIALAPDVARGDDVRPVQLQVREQEPGLFLVQWQVPQVMAPQAMPTPRMPSSCEPEGERTITEQPGAWMNRQVYRCRDGISGQSIGIAYRFGNPSLSTVLRIELLSGERHATLLAPGEDSWQVPPAVAIDAPLRAAQGAVLEGVRHVFQQPIHLAFLLVIVVVGRVGLVGRFGLGQLLAVVLAAAGAQVSIIFGEVGMALATVLLAKEALRPVTKRKQLGGLVVAAGLVHGLGWASVVNGTASMLVAVLGMDVTFLVFGVGLAKIVASTRVRRAAAYAAGITAVALGFGLWSADRSPQSESTVPVATRLPGLGSGTSMTRASRRVSPQTPDATIQSFVAIEAFEVRHEVLVRLQDVADRVGLAGVDVIEVEEQSAVKERVAELVTTNHTLELDGTEAPGLVERVDFMTVDTKGVLPRPTPIQERLAEAFVGVTVVRLTPATARYLVLTWSAFDVAPEIPATVTDPEVSRAVLLTPGEPMLRWENVLAEDPVPTVAAVSVEPVRIPIPLASLPLLALALAIVWTATRRKRPPLPALPALARVILALAILVGPIADIAVPLPYSTVPTEDQARRILAGVLPNVYRAFEFRDESMAYDRLAVSVTGETLTDIYLEHRRALEMEERGGARARVEAVEVHGVPSVTPGAAGGFDAEASWSVSGTVTHFGHRHFRQNRYEARVGVVPADGSWKIRSVDILDERRVR